MLPDLGRSPPRAGITVALRVSRRPRPRTSGSKSIRRPKLSIQLTQVRPAVSQTDCWAVKNGQSCKLKLAELAEMRVMLGCPSRDGEAVKMLKKRILSLVKKTKKKTGKDWNTQSTGKAPSPSYVCHQSFRVQQQPYDEMERGDRWLLPVLSCKPFLSFQSIFRGVNPQSIEKFVTGWSICEPCGRGITGRSIEIKEDGFPQVKTFSLFVLSKSVID